MFQSPVWPRGDPVSSQRVAQVCCTQAVGLAEAAIEKCRYRGQLQQVEIGEVVVALRL